MKAGSFFDVGSFFSAGSFFSVGTLGAIATVLVTVAFFGVCCWAFSPTLKQRFEDDAKLPFADDIEHEPRDHQP